MKLGSFLPVVFGCALVTSLGRAEPRAEDKAQLTQAQSSFAEGRALMDAGKYIEAVEQFRRAAEVKNTPGIRYHIALCLEQAGRLVEADAEYSQAEQLLADYAQADVAALLPEARARVAQAMPRLLVRDLTPGAEVQIDGHVVEAAAALPLNPGAHSLFISAPGREALHLELVLEVGEQRPVSGALRASAPRPPAPAPVTPEGRPPAARRAVFWTATGVAVVGAGVGVVGAMLRQSAGDNVTRYGDAVDDASGGSSGACNPDGGSQPSACKQLQDAVAQRDSATAMMFAGFGAAAAGATVAVLTHFFWKDSPVQVVALPTFDTRSAPAGATLRVTGSF